MDAVSLSSGHLTAALAAGNTMAASLGGTFSSNAGWMILVAGAGLIIGILIGLLRRVSHLGMSGNVEKMRMTGVSDAIVASKYLDSGGDIRMASNQDFIRQWGKTHGYF